MDQDFLDDNDDRQLMPIKDIDKLKDALLLIQIPYIIVLSHQILKPNPYLT